MLKQVALGAAAISLALGSVAHAADAPVRSASKAESEELAGTPVALLVIGGVIAALAILEVTEAIDIFEDDDEPVSP